MSTGTLMGITQDPLLFQVAVPLSATFYPLGFPVEITTNSQEVLDAGAESWGGWAGGTACPTSAEKLQGVLEADGRHVATEGAVVRLQIVVHGSGAPGEPVFRGREHLLSIVAGADNFVMADAERMFAYGFFTKEAVADRGWFRWYFLEAAVYFLIVSELVPYKRIDTAIRLCNERRERLLIAGSGPDYKRLRAIAGPTIEFLGRVSDDELRDLYARCRAFLLPGEEDFGMTPVEALASGKPVIALARGGALETVPSFGGIFYDDPDSASMHEAFDRFHAFERDIDPTALQGWSQRFHESEFMQAMSALLTAPTSRVPAAHLAFSR